jgi:hypothetical protein
VSDAALFLVDRTSGVGTGVEPATVDGEAGHLAGVRGRRPNETPKACSFILSPLFTETLRVTPALEFFVRGEPLATPSWPDWRFRSTAARWEDQPGCGRCRVSIVHAALRGVRGAFSRPHDRCSDSDALLVLDCLVDRRIYQQADRATYRSIPRVVRTSTPIDSPRRVASMRLRHAIRTS